MNEEQKAKVRKYNRNIEISGAAMIVYGMWVVVKFLFPLFIGTMKLADVLEMEIQDDSQERIYILIIVIIMLATIFITHCILGRAAIKFARGKTKKSGFVIWAIILFISNVITFSAYPDMFRNVKDLTSADDVFASIMVDLTLLFILADMIFSTFRVNRLRKLEEKAA